jgi:hypothetical protein
MPGRAPGRTPAAAPRARGDDRRHSGRGEGTGEPSRSHGPERRSGEARTARRGDPRRRRRALAERSEDGPARGPAREGQDELEEQILQGVSAASRKHTGWGRGVSKARR